MMTPIEILLVEDNESDAEITMHVLRKSHVVNSVQIARDGRDALDFLFHRGAWQNRPVSGKPLVILLDLHLPGMGGIAVLKALKGDNSTRAIPVMIVSASQRPEDLMDAYQLGAAAFVQKPLAFAEFSIAISKIGMYWMAVNDDEPGGEV